MVDKKDDILENILHCSKKFKESYNSMEACISGYSLAIMTDENGNTVHSFKKPLDPCKNNYTFASHLGLVGEGMDNLNFSNQIAVYDKFYYYLLLKLDFSILSHLLVVLHMEFHTNE